jgi:hypothetical protein
VTPGPWGIWFEFCEDKARAAEELAEQVMRTPDQDFCDGVYLLDANGKCPAETGCGPTSKQNAEYIARCSPDRMATLLDAYETMRAALSILSREIGSWEMDGPHGQIAVADFIAPALSKASDPAA